MVHAISRLRRRDDGAVAVLTIILTSVVFIGLSALVVDLGMARDTRRQAQNAADASVLAAGNVLYEGDGTPQVNDAVLAAKSYMDKNLGVTLSPTDWANCRDASALASTPDPPNTCISFDNGTPTNGTPTLKVRVKVPPRAVSTPFAGIWGISSVPVSAAAQINFDNDGLARCGLCVIGSVAHSLQVGNITVEGASVAINGTLDANSNVGGIQVSPSPERSINLEGPHPTKGSYTEPVRVNQPRVADPLALIPMPNYTAPDMPNYIALAMHTNSCTEGPGIYVSLEACPGGMLPGLYVLTGVTGGNFGIVGRGVTLDLVCSTSGVPHPCNPAGEVGGSLLFSGNDGYLNITAPAAPQDNAGLAIVADRNNITTLAFKGNAAANTGTIYALRGTLEYNGNGALGTDSLIVVNDVSFAGAPPGSGFISRYTAANNVVVPPTSMHLSN